MRIIISLLIIFSSTNSFALMDKKKVVSEQFHDFYRALMFRDIKEVQKFTSKKYLKDLKRNYDFSKVKNPKYKNFKLKERIVIKETGKPGRFKVFVSNGKNDDNRVKYLIESKNKKITVTGIETDL